jgi:hypothetical protein
MLADLLMREVGHVASWLTVRLACVDCSRRQRSGAAKAPGRVMSFGKGRMPRHAGVIADRARAAASTVEQRIGSKERAAVPYHSVPSGPQRRESSSLNLQSHSDCF